MSRVLVGNVLAHLEHACYIEQARLDFFVNWLCDPVVSWSLKDSSLASLALSECCNFAATHRQPSSLRLVRAGVVDFDLASTHYEDAVIWRVTVWSLLLVLF